MKKTNKPVMAVIYCRTACSPATGEDDAILAQEAECRDYAAMHGLTVIDMFHDRGKSGMRADDRPGWLAMMQFLQKTSAPHYVLVKDKSRLARDLALCVELEATYEQLGHRVIVVDNYQAGDRAIILQ